VPCNKSPADLLYKDDPPPPREFQKDNVIAAVKIIKKTVWGGGSPRLIIPWTELVKIKG